MKKTGIMMKVAERSIQLRKSQDLTLEEIADILTQEGLTKNDGGHINGSYVGSCLSLAKFNGTKVPMKSRKGPISFATEIVPHKSKKTAMVTLPVLEPATQGKIAIVFGNRGEVEDILKGWLAQ